MPDIRRSPLSCLLFHMLVCLGLSNALSGTTSGADIDLETAQEYFQAGEYQKALDAAAKGTADYRYNERWWKLKILTELEIGEYESAKETLQAAIKIHRASISLRYLGYRVFQLNNQPAEAQAMFEQIDAQVRSWPSRYSDAASSVVIGRMLLQSGADARQVLELFYDRARRLSPRNVDVLMAAIDLSLDKHAYDLAAKDLTTALELDATNPGLHYRQALAFAESDSKKASAALQAALKINPQHIDSLLHVARNAISVEQYDAAEASIDAALKVNAKHQIAWCLKAVLANLRGKTKLQKQHYISATSVWKDNPQVDYEIGLQLSRKYRFSEAADFQRRALRKRADFLPAKLQLAQDLLRLGDPSGWELADEVNQVDGYNVVMHNLMTLHDHLKDFRTIEAPGLIVRMEDREAQLYGEEVIELLTQARDVLAKKYEIKMDKPVVVEIYPDQADFAIRTFGLPGGDGYLGVCFGRVITANSPASRRDSPSNWQAVLWHEFCHAVTLEKTNNRMPRWLSEGISVYEERQRDAAWGEKINPRYREMMLSEELTPVSKLSSAFLSPKSGLHLQFAYLESSLVVEFLVEQYGQEMINRVLTDLGVGMPIAESLTRYVGSLEKLDIEFAEFAKKQANDFGGELTFDQPPLTTGSDVEQIRAWLKEHPNNYDATKLLAIKLLAEDQTDEAIQLLKKLVEELPQQSGENSAWRWLAAVHQKSQNADAERKALENRIQYDSDAVSAYRRLMEIHQEAEQWKSLRSAAEKLVAVDPLDRAGQSTLALAAEKMNDSQLAVRYLERLLLFDNTDTADTHYRLAGFAFGEQRSDDTKRHILMALERAPRFRDAHKLLLEIESMTKKD